MLVSTITRGCSRQLARSRSIERKVRPSRAVYGIGTCTDGNLRIVKLERVENMIQERVRRLCENQQETEAAVWPSDLCSAKRPDSLAASVLTYIILWLSGVSGATYLSISVAPSY